MSKNAEYFMILVVGIMFVIIPLIVGRFCKRKDKKYVESLKGNTHIKIKSDSTILCVGISVSIYLLLTLIVHLINVLTNNEFIENAVVMLQGWFLIYLLVVAIPKFRRYYYLEVFKDRDYFIYKTRTKAYTIFYSEIEKVKVSKLNSAKLKIVTSQKTYSISSMMLGLDYLFEMIMEHSIINNEK